MKIPGSSPTCGLSVPPAMLKPNPEFPCNHGKQWVTKRSAQPELIVCSVPNGQTYQRKHEQLNLHQCDKRYLKWQKPFSRFFPSINMVKAKYMNCTAASQRVSTEVLWLHVWGNCPPINLYIYIGIIYIYIWFLLLEFHYTHCLLLLHCHIPSPSYTTIPAKRHYSVHIPTSLSDELLH